MKRTKSLHLVVLRAIELINDGSTLMMAVSTACDEGGRLNDFIKVKEAIQKKFNQQTTRRD
jgi:hypothetical protein